MHHTTRTQRTALPLLCLALAGLMACQAQEPAPQEAEEMGRVQLNLAGESSVGDLYRLDNANFAIQQVDDAGNAAGDMTLISDNDDTTLELDLPVGSYTVYLGDGWQLQKLQDDGSYANIAARLLSPNPEIVEIIEYEATALSFQFQVGDSIVTTEGEGRLDIGIDVVEGDLAEVCGDGEDNDLDGSLDCDDPDCAADALCSTISCDMTCDTLQEETRTACYDARPEDPALCEELIALSDADHTCRELCTSGMTCEDQCMLYTDTLRASCTEHLDGAEGECDALTEAVYATCVSSCADDAADDEGSDSEDPELLPERDHCDDGIDNDGNGLIDCEDPECADDAFCQVEDEQDAVATCQASCTTTEDTVYADLCADPAEAMGDCDLLASSLESRATFMCQDFCAAELPCEDACMMTSDQVMESCFEAGFDPTECDAARELAYATCQSLACQ